VAIIFLEGEKVLYGTGMHLRASGSFKYANHKCCPQTAKCTFAEGLMTIANSLLLGQYAIGLNFYDDSGRSQLAD
jgi:hypothetical protein